MNKNITFAPDQPSYALLQCLALAVSYVGSLYIFRRDLPRDHPITIKNRMCSVAIVCALAPFFVYSLARSDDINGHSLWTWLGVNTLPLLGVVLPLLLTMILFLGPLTLLLVDRGIAELLHEFQDFGSCLRDLKWHRTYVVAPFSEELIFRSCMMPLLVPVFGLHKSVLLAPLFFGVAHFHHISEQLRLGHNVLNVLVSAVFQMSYTTVFGAYSAFLFVRTGNLLGPIVCHCFCNYMGFPDFQGAYYSKHRLFLGLMFVVGLGLFMYLLYPLTDPALFGSVYYNVQR
jgi:prenyl protein peptidase